jgi:hypothetical protein
MDKIHAGAWIIVGLLLLAGYLRSASTSLQAVDVILISMTFVYCFALGGTIGRKLA